MLFAAMNTVSVSSTQRASRCFWRGAEAPRVVSAIPRGSNTCSLATPPASHWSAARPLLGLVVVPDSGDQRLVTPRCGAVRRGRPGAGGRAGGPQVFRKRDPGDARDDLPQKVHPSRLAAGGGGGQPISALQYIVCNRMVQWLKWLASCLNSIP
jgi:hypothetical protein